jgi:myeloid leukemia factor 1
MQGGRDPFFGFGDPFGSFGGLRGQRSLISGFFGGRDPFDDPFFTQPFGGASRFLEHRPSQSNLSRGPIIEELNSDDEKDEKETGKDKEENPRKHGRSSKKPFVEDPDDETTEKKSRHMSHRNDINQMYYARSQPQSHSFTFQSSTVSYGGANGAYYTSSRTRRSGSDGLTFDEYKEADSSTGQAAHRVSRGIHDKGHSVTRKLKSDGNVDMMQTLHNLNEDELVGFDEAWKGNARKHIPGWSGEFATRGVIGDGRHRPNRGGWALPSTERWKNSMGNSKPEAGGVACPPPHAGRMKTSLSDGTGPGPGSSCVRSVTGSSNKANRS